MKPPIVPTPILTSEEALACDRLMAELLAELDGSVVRPLERLAPSSMPMADDDARVA